MGGRMLAQALYVLFGTLYLAALTAVLLFRTGSLPDAILDLAQGDLNAVHISQKFAALLVFAGLITLWFPRHYEQSLFFHWAMTVFWALFGIIHWFDVRGPVRFDAGVLINAMPFLLFLSVGVLARNRKASHRG